MVRLGDVCEISSSKTNLTDDKIWLLNLDMVEQQTGKIISYYYVNRNELNGSITQFDTENILYSKLRPNLNKVVVPDRNGFSTSELLPLKPNSKILCREYLALYLRSDSFVSWAISKTAGAKMPRLGTKALLDKEIPLPPLDEQRRIAATLDKVTDLISKRRQQLDKLNELVKARFVEMFGDTIINPHELPSVSLSNLANIVSGITKGRKTKGEELFEVPYMAVSNVKSGYIDWTTVKTIEATKSEIEQYHLQPFDVLMTEGGDPDKLGRGAIIQNPPKDCIHQNHIFRVRVDSSCLLPQYLEEYLQHPKAKKYFLDCAKQTTGIASINMTQLRNLPVLLPSLEQQKKFSDFTEQISHHKLTIQRSLDKMETLKKALMQEYFD